MVVELMVRLVLVMFALLISYKMLRVGWENLCGASVNGVCNNYKDLLLANFCFGAE